MPVAVLAVICIVVTAALAFTYGKAKPIIDSNEKRAANEARTELIADGDSFSPADVELLTSPDGKVTVTEVYVADNKAGMVVTLETKSFGGVLKEMVGVDKDGKLTGIKVLSHADTPGLGTKAMEPSHLKQYKGIGKLTSPSAKDEPEVDHISGASISSNAIHYGAFIALQQYEKMGGIK